MKAIHCPLCVQPLGLEDVLVRYCWLHPNLSEALAPVSLGRLLCPGRDSGGCVANTSVKPPGVYLRHVGCGAATGAPRFNIYWSPKLSTVDVPGAPVVRDNLYVEGTTPESQPESVSHWQVAVLRRIQQDAKRHEVLQGSEMWYPSTLLRTRLESSGDEGRRATSILVCGAQKVGKTVLAMQLLDDDGYLGSLMPGFVSTLTLESFFYVMPTGEDEKDKEFKEALMYHEANRNEENASRWLFATKPNPGNLKAVFVRRSLRPEKSTQSPAPTVGLRRAAGVLGYALRVALGVNQESVEAPREVPAHWRSVTLYDTAGEDSESGFAERLVELEGVADVVAVLVSAEDLLNDKGGSVLTAWQRLTSLMGAPGFKETRRVALVFTKLDVLFETTAGLRKEAVAAADGTERALPLALKLLENHAGAKLARKLAGILKRPDSIVNEVFLTWTEDLKGSPLSHGLVRLLCWCLESRPSALGLAPPSP